MSALSEKLAEKIFDVLSNDNDFTEIVGTKIYADIAPQSADYPFCTFQMQSNVAGHTFQRLSHETITPFIKVSSAQDTSTAQSPQETVESALARIETLFDMQTFTVTGATIQMMKMSQIDTSLGELDKTVITRGILFRAEVTNG